MPGDTEQKEQAPSTKEISNDSLTLALQYLTDKDLALGAARVSKTWNTTLKTRIPSYAAIIRGVTFFNAAFNSLIAKFSVEVAKIEKNTQKILKHLHQHIDLQHNAFRESKAYDNEATLLETFYTPVYLRALGTYRPETTTFFFTLQEARQIHQAQPHGRIMLSGMLSNGKAALQNKTTNIAALTRIAQDEKISAPDRFCEIFFSPDVQRSLSTAPTEGGMTLDDMLALAHHPSGTGCIEVLASPNGMMAKRKQCITRAQALRLASMPSNENDIAISDAFLHILVSPNGQKAIESRFLNLDELITFIENQNNQRKRYVLNFLRKILVDPYFTRLNTAITQRLIPADKITVFVQQGKTGTFELLLSEEGWRVLQANRGNNDITSQIRALSDEGSFEVLEEVIVNSILSEDERAALNHPTVRQFPYGYMPVLHHLMADRYDVVRLLLSNRGLEVMARKQAHSEFSRMRLSYSSNPDAWLPLLYAAMRNEERGFEEGLRGKSVAEAATLRRERHVRMGDLPEPLPATSFAP